MNQSCVLVVLSWGFASSACVGRLAEDNLPCPCESGWTCCASTNTCVPAQSACGVGDSGIAKQVGVDASLPEASSAADGASLAETGGHAGLDGAPSDANGMGSVDTACGVGCSGAVCQYLATPDGDTDQACALGCASGIITSLYTSCAGQCVQANGCVGSQSCTAWGATFRVTCGSVLPPCPTPTFNRPDGTILTPCQNIVITAAGLPLGAKIVFTTDNTLAGRTSPTYDEGVVGVPVTQSPTAFHAITTSLGASCIDSAEAVATYTIAMPEGGTGVSLRMANDVAQISMGSAGMGVVMNDGTVWAAGEDPFLPFGGTTFAAVGALTDVAQLALSPFQTLFGCALLKTGSVVCWGTNEDGELGTGGTPAASTVPVAVPGLANVIQVATGSGHACALESNGDVFCWGLDTHGQVGRAPATSFLAPVRVFRGARNASGALAAGNDHTCVVDAQGKVWCWGKNDCGEVGNGSLTDQFYPVVVGGLSGIVQIGLGDSHSCALGGDGTVFCWGANSDGELGTGATSACESTPLKTGLTGVQELAAEAFGACARVTGGCVDCWGHDLYGEVGDGTGSPAIASPTWVSSLPLSASIFGGGSNGCSVGVDTTIACWGDNYAGQLGNGSFTNALAPASITLDVVPSDGGAPLHVDAGGPSAEAGGG